MSVESLQIIGVFCSVFGTAVSGTAETINIQSLMMTALLNLQYIPLCDQNKIEIWIFHISPSVFPINMSHMLARSQLLGYSSVQQNQNRIKIRRHTSTDLELCISP